MTVVNNADGLTSGVAAKKVDLYSTFTRATEEEQHSEAADEDMVELSFHTPCTDIGRSWIAVKECATEIEEVKEDGQQGSSVVRCLAVWSALLLVTSMWHTTCAS